jgi:hypothetical protein
MSRTEEEIIRSFNTTVQSIIRKIAQKSRKDIEVANLDRLKKRIGLLLNTNGEQSLLVESSPFFIQFRERILERDQNKRDNFFLTMDVRAEYLKIKSEVAREDEFVFELTDSIREHYKKIPQNEKDEIYVEIVSLFKGCIEYKKLKQGK